MSYLTFLELVQNYYFDFQEIHQSSVSTLLSWLFQVCCLTYPSSYTEWWLSFGISPSTAFASEDFLRPLRNWWLSCDFPTLTVGPSSKTLSGLSCFTRYGEAINLGLYLYSEARCPQIRLVLTLFLLPFSRISHFSGFRRHEAWDRFAVRCPY